MGMMTPPAGKALYPTLIALPELSAERRDEVRRVAGERMRAGVTLLLEGADRLTAATASEDRTAMQAAVVQMRGGLMQYESGLSALRALDAGKAPKEVALEWFRQEMSLPVHEDAADGASGPGWFHIALMFALVAFAAAAIALYFVKMRRAARLLERLTAPSAARGVLGAPAVAPVPAAAASSLAPTPAAARSLPIEAPTPPGRWTGVLRVASVYRDTPTVKTFWLVSPDGGELPFRFLPGQYLTLTVTLDGKPHRRAYSLASAPTQRGHCEITVKREGSGLVSPYLHDAVKAGDLLAVMAPSGAFTFTGTEANGIVLVAGGVGITPLMSIIRYLTDVGWAGEILVFYSCRNTDEFLFRDELEGLQRRHPNLRVTAVLEQTEGTAWMGPRGRLRKALIADSVSDLPSRRFHLCGPPPMMDAVKGFLSELGVPAEQVRTEAFGPLKPPAPSLRAPPSPAAAGAASVATVTFTTSKKSAPLPPGTTVLEAAESVGIDIESACRSGTCGSCKVKLLSGRVRMPVEEALTPSDKAAGVILACQAVSEGDVTVDA